MRTDKDFIKAYSAALEMVDPSTKKWPVTDRRALALTELCLHALASFLPDEDVSAVPFLMLGYPSVVDSQGREEIARMLASLRHLAGRFGSMSAWLDACRQHEQFREHLRCYELVDRRPVLRTTAPTVLLKVLEDALTTPVLWKERSVRVAEPGAARVAVDRGHTLLSYQIPVVSADQQKIRQHVLAKRSENPAINVSFDQMLEVAKKVDAREKQADWPKSLPRLHLEKRLEKLRIKGFQEKFFDGNVLRLDGVNHLVGMLSSGKSTLVMALLLTLTLGGSGKRITILVTDTIQGATLAARLRRHGVRATVMSSLYNREKHLDSIHFQQGLSANGWSLSGVGDLAQNFSVACPLDGLQGGLEVARGDGSEPFYPSFKEKQCHRIFQKMPDDEASDEAQEDLSEANDDGTAKSCPLWAVCPAQEQQRSAVDAEVLIMTPQAFVHMSPDKWTSDRHLTMPELVQFTTDLVIIDEVDGVQKMLDDAFAPRSPIMGYERDVYLPSISARSMESIRERSGAQFRKATNARWQNNFHTFSRMVGMLYALVQNEQTTLRSFFADTPFTAAGILYELWRRKKYAPQGGSDNFESAISKFADEGTESEFLQVIKVASAISRFSRNASLHEEEEDQTAEFDDIEFAEAAAALQEIARQVLFSDYYIELVPEVERLLLSKLSPFCLVSEEEIAALGNTESDPKLVEQAKVNARSNALTLLMAVVAELALSYYNWLVKAQPAVANDFGIDEAEVLTQANSLIRHYRSLLPSNPAGSVFGLLYDEPGKDRETQMGGKLTLINHLGVGRYLLTHLHDLLRAEGQAGPHVLLLSGTSWAGGSARRMIPDEKRPVDCASPSFDVQVPVKGILVQPEAELDAIKKSIFSLVNIRDQDQNQFRVSGLPEKDRRQSLAIIAQRFAARRDDLNLFEERWLKLERAWGAEDIEDRRRAMLVVNSYADAAIVADALMEALETHGYADWKVFCLVRDKGDDTNSASGFKPKRAEPLPGSLVERFGEEGEKSILVAPMQIVARGHNILNGHGRAAISTIYFLHRPHPRPDDLGTTIGRLNRFALERFENGLKSLDDENSKLPLRARRVRYAATSIVRKSLDYRHGFQGLLPEYKAQFAWDMLTPLWQTIGRGIRGGCPVFIGFVDYKFAPLSFDRRNSDDPKDTGKSSALVQAITQLRLAMDPKNNRNEHEVARLLYEPFYEALSKTEGLHYE